MCLGLNSEHVKGSRPSEYTANLLRKFRELSSSPLSGAAAMYVYELQVPEVMKVKMDGLKRFYNVPDEYLDFFKVRASIDVRHTDAMLNFIQE